MQIKNLDTGLLDEIDSKIRNAHKKIIIIGLSANSIFWSYLLDKLGLCTLLANNPQTRSNDDNQLFSKQQNHLFLSQLDGLMCCINIVEDQLYKLKERTCYSNDLFVTDEFLLNLAFQVYEKVSKYDDKVEKQARDLIEAFMLDNLASNYLKVYISNHNIDMNNNQPLEDRVTNTSETDYSKFDIWNCMWKPSFQVFENDKDNQLTGHFEFVVIRTFRQLNNQTYDHVSASDDEAELNGNIANRSTFANLNACYSSLGYFDTSELFHNCAMQVLYDVHHFNREFDQVFQNDESYGERAHVRYTGPSRWRTVCNTNGIQPHTIDILDEDADNSRITLNETCKSSLNDSVYETTPTTTAASTSRQWTVAPKTMVSRTSSSNNSPSASLDENSFGRNSLKDWNSKRMRLDPIGTKPSSMCSPSGNHKNKQRQHRKMFANEIIKTKQTYEFNEKNIWKYNNHANTAICSPFTSYNFKLNIKFRIERRFSFSDKYPMSNMNMTNIRIPLNEKFFTDMPLNNRIYRANGKLASTYGARAKNFFIQKNANTSQSGRESFCMQRSSVSSASSSFGKSEEIYGENYHASMSYRYSSKKIYDHQPNYSKYHYIAKKHEVSS